MLKVDVVVPVCNESECLPTLIARLKTMRERLVEWEMTFLFVDDGSQDDSRSIIESEALKHPYIRLISFSKNFGHQAAVTAGLDYCDGDYVVLIDADLQDPPELIEPMVNKAHEGFDVVYGKRRVRKGETLSKRITAKLFYYVLSRMCKVPIPTDTGDFRVMSQRVVRSLRGLRERHRFIRGLVPWVGFSATPFLYDREPRLAGETNFPFFKMFKFALDAVFSFSNYPLRIATYLGFAMTGVALLAAAFLCYLRFFTTYTVPGITAVILTVIFMVGMQNITLGIAGEYIGRIFEESKGRPLYIVERALNLPNAPTLLVAPESLAFPTGFRQPA
jgi:glycosyltransferase involved in cell wall biosynthesis